MQCNAVSGAALLLLWHWHRHAASDSPCVVKSKPHLKQQIDHSLQGCEGLRWPAMPTPTVTGSLASQQPVLSSVTFDWSTAYSLETSTLKPTAVQPGVYESGVAIPMRQTHAKGVHEAQFKQAILPVYLVQHRIGRAGSRLYSTRSAKRRGWLPRRLCTWRPLATPSMTGPMRSRQ
jgi:hypothetical protein